MNAQENFYEVSRKKFENFFNSLSKEDNVGIFVHANCLDGMASAIFVDAILEEKGIKPKAIEFFAYGSEMINNISKRAEENDLDKVVIADIAIDEELREEFINFRNKLEVLFIDHHLPSQKLEDSEGIIKANGVDCAAWLVYELGKNLFDREKWNWLIGPAMIHEFAYNKDEHFEFLNKLYPGINREKMGDSAPGELMKKMGYVINFYKKEPMRAYELIKKKDFNSMEEAEDKISKEFNYWVEKFKKEKEFYPEADLYFYHLAPKYDLETSGITTVSSLSDRSKIWVGICDIGENKMKISLRNNGDKYNLNEIAKKAIEGLKETTAGGHKPAAGASILKKDLVKFKQNLIKAIIEAKEGLKKESPRE